MVALERVKEYSDVKREAADIVEPRPSAAWPSEGAIQVEDLSIRYAVSGCCSLSFLLADCICAARPS